MEAGAPGHPGGTDAERQVTTPTTSTPPRRLLRSIVAILVAFFAVFVLSLGTDQVLHVVKVYPPWGQPMYDTGLSLLALSYRLVYTVVGGYIAARLAPNSPVRHALVRKERRSIGENPMSGCPGGTADGRTFRLFGTTARFFL